MNNKRLFFSTLVLTAALTVCRVLLLPGRVPAGSRMGTVSYPLLVIMAVAAAAALWAGFRRGEYQPLSGPGAGRVAVSGLLLGAGMLAFTAADAFRWIGQGLTPAPWDTAANVVETVALYVTEIAGILGGLFLTVYFVGWKKQPYAPLNKALALPLAVAGAGGGIGLIVLALRAEKIGVGQLVMIAAGAGLLAAFVLWQMRGEFSSDWLWLLPGLWVSARLVRLVVHYAMSVDVSAGVYDVLVWGAAAVFVLAFAQYITGAMTPNRHMRGLAVLAAALAISATLSRWTLALMGQEAAAYFAIPDVPLLLVGLFALAAAPSLGQKSDARHEA